jgi:Flp pilus assembly protein TadG
MNYPDETTLTPDAASRLLAQSQRSRRATDTVVERAATAFDKTVDLGARNGFTEGIRALIRGNAA